ncbi:MAG: ParB/RepB/Spo0J family partition protein [Coriobacteriia bacterium]|nr:ParB/RepB/Spo0J family partition protein [Coriobacteriia bacterium]MCL2871285.1 ParB/RepB/Spo0J family partition protein [Coriobacteriia bacterium]
MASRNSGLGRGLSSLISSAAVESGTAGDSVNELSIALIEPNPLQPRTDIDEEKIAELSASIAKRGVLQPIIVRPKGEKYEIVAGERRWRASRMAGLEAIPVHIRTFDDGETFEIALIENLQREDLNAIEAAYGYRNLINERQLTQSELADLLAKSRASITNALRLLDLPEEVQELVYEGSLSAGHARAILTVSDDPTRIKLAQKAIEEGLSVRALESLARLSGGGVIPSASKRPISPKSYKAAARKLRKFIGGNVRVKQTKDKSKIEIEFANEEELERIYRLITQDERPLVRSVD